MIFPHDDNIEEINSKYPKRINEKDKEWEKELVRIIIEKKINYCRYTFAKLRGISEQEMN